MSLKFLKTIEASLKRVTRLIALLAIPALIALALHWHSAPVRAADTSPGLSSPGGLVTKGRDILVIDGDTIMIAGQVVDIAGMDAPELGQQCLHNGSFWDCGMSSAMQKGRFTDGSCRLLRIASTKSTVRQLSSGSKRS